MHQQPQSSPRAFVSPRLPSQNTSIMSPREHLLQSADVGPPLLGSTSDVVYANSSQGGAKSSERTDGGLSPRSHVRQIKNLSESVFEQYEVVREASLDDERMPPLDSASQEIYSVDTSTCAGDYTVASEVSNVEEDAPSLAPFTGAHVVLSRQDTPVLTSPGTSSATISRAAVPPLGLKGIIMNTAAEATTAALGQGDIQTGDEGKATWGQGAVSTISNVLPPLAIADVQAGGHVQALAEDSNTSGAEIGIHAVDGSGQSQDRKRHDESMPRVATGPWGGRRWVPKSSHYPRRAQPLRWFRVTRNHHPEMSIMGSGDVTLPRPPPRLTAARYSQQIHPETKHETSRRTARAMQQGQVAAGQMADEESAWHGDDLPKPWSDAGSPIAEEQGDVAVCQLKETGSWMSSMFLGSLHLHDNLTSANEVRRGTGGRASSWLGTRVHAGPNKTPSTSNVITGFRKIDPLRTTIPLAMMKNPAVKFDHRAANAAMDSLMDVFEAGTSSDGTFIRHARRTLPMSAREAPKPGANSTAVAQSNSTAVAQSPRRSDVRDASSTFLTSVAQEYDDLRYSAQTARPAGNETERVRGSKSARRADDADRNEARNKYLAINAGRNKGDFYKPRSLNPGWNPQDFRSSISTVREARPRKTISTSHFPRQSDSVQLASLCLSFHTCETARAVCAAVHHAVHMVVSGSECMLLRRSGEDAVFNYAEDNARTTAVELGVGVVGSALIAAFPITWNLYDENLVLDVTDVEVGIKDIGMVFTAPLRRPVSPEARQATMDDWTLQAPFGVFIVQRMFGSFDKGETEMLNVIADHASTALSRFLGGASEFTSSTNTDSVLGYPVLENILSLQRGPSYDFVQTRTSSASSMNDGAPAVRSPRMSGAATVRRPQFA